MKLHAFNFRDVRQKNAGCLTGMFFRQRWFLSSLLVVIAILQPLLAENSPMKFRRYTLENGLSQSSVNAIAQDAQGFLWFGTQDGLNRYDGYSFKVYRNNPADSLSLGDNYVWTLLTDSRGHLWVGTQSGGLNLYLPEADGFRVFRSVPGDTTALLSNNITGLYEDSDGLLWIGQWAGGLSSMNLQTGQIQHYFPQPVDSSTLPGPNVGVIAGDVNGDLWIGTWSGLARLKKADRHQKKFTRYRANSDVPGELPHPQVWSLLADRRSPGDLWVGTFGGGLCKFDSQTGQFIAPLQDRPGDFTVFGTLINHLWQDDNGHIWVCSFDRGLLANFDPQTGQFEQYANDPNDPASIGSNEILSIFCDTAGSLWVGTGSGVSMHNPNLQKFDHIRYLPQNPKSISYPKVRAIMEDRLGGLWVGTKGGGLDYQPAGSRGFVHHRHDPANPNSINEDRIYCMLEHTNGDIWVGTESGGLNRLDRRTGYFKRYQFREDDPSGISSNTIMTLLEDRQGRLWIGTGNGLNLYLPGRDAFRKFRSDPQSADSLSGNSVWALFEDSRSHLWVGTWGRGLSRFDPQAQRFESFLSDPGDPNSLSSNTIFCIAEDAGGTIWIGTERGGISVYDRAAGRFHRITEQDGLPNNSVYGILPDEWGNLWVSSNYGIARIFWEYNGQASGFDGNFVNLKKSLNIRKYDVNDGLQSNEFNQGAYFRSRSGRLYFGGVNGLNLFHPEDITDNTFVPPLVITQLRVFEQPVLFSQAVADNQPLRFKHMENYFSVEYASLDYVAPTKNQYAYILEGLHESWIKAGTRRYASFTHLDPGEYTLRIKGSNSDGHWNENGINLKIVIDPPFWATWWFRMLMVAVAGALVYGVFRYRLNRLLEMERLRTRLAADLHDELAGNLSSIAMFGQIIQNELPGGDAPDGSLRQLLQRIVNLSKDSVSSIRDIIWAIDPKPETIENLLLKLHDFTATHCSAREIQLVFDMPPKAGLPGANLRPEQRQNLWLLLKEAVQNAIKHSAARRLTITTAYDAGNLMITIHDNGKGFSMDCQNTGKGLQTMQSRAKLLDADLTIHSLCGEGTAVHLKYRLGRGLRVER